MTKQKPKRGLGRGLSALIPESDIDFLKSVARGDTQAEPVFTGRPAPTSGPLADRDGFHPAALTDITLTQEKPAPAPVGGQLANSDGPDEAELTAAGPARSRILHVEVGSVEANPFQPRQVFDEEELQQLADSIRDHGILQPVLLRPIPSPHPANSQIVYQLIAGERRWRACALAGLQFVPAIVRTVNDLEALELALIENVQRHDIGPIESAEAYRRMAREFEISQEEIARRVGKSRASVANTIRLLDLPIEAIEALKLGKITEGHGRALLTATGDGSRRALLRRVLRDGLSVREVERLARLGEEAEPNSAPVPPLSSMRTPDLERLERSLQKALGTRLKLKPRRRGGQIIIDFFSPEDLQRLVKRLTGLDGQATLAAVSMQAPAPVQAPVAVGVTMPLSDPPIAVPQALNPQVPVPQVPVPQVLVPQVLAPEPAPPELVIPEGTPPINFGKVHPENLISPVAWESLLETPQGDLGEMVDPTVAPEQKRLRPATEAVRLSPLPDRAGRASLATLDPGLLPDVGSGSKKTKSAGKNALSVLEADGKGRGSQGAAKGAAKGGAKGSAKGLAAGRAKERLKEPSKATNKEPSRATIKESIKATSKATKSEGSSALGAGRKR